MIYIKNSQRAIKINANQLKTDLQIILDALKYSNFDISVLITTNKTIRAYNRDYRQKDTPTDILSFPYHPELQAGKRIRVKEIEDRNLGDLVISAEYVSKEARELKVTFEARMKKLLVHGVCHLLGYDHIIDADWRRMRAKEGFLLKKLMNI
ncbi:MAG: rRNA maturation RNase YbeY [Candidatus Babeliaceae bacterium]|nr:rRNA maturation RNase YbeY [Candidatus Babeliaceae bacterium]